MRRTVPAAVATALIALSALSGAAPVAEAQPAAAVAAAPGATSIAGLQPLDRCRVPVTTADLSEGYAVEPEAMGSEGTGHVMTVYVDFPDSPADPAVISDFEKVFDDGSALIGEQSGGALTLERSGDAAWVRMPQPTTAYDVAADPGAAERLYADAIAQVDATTDFSGTDVVWLVWNATDTSDEARSASWNNSPVVADGRDLNRAVLFRASDLVGDAGWTPAHETGHTLGLPDLYDGGAPSSGNADAAVGLWDMMGNPFEEGGPTLLGWHQWRLGWLPDNTVSCVQPGETAAVSLTAVENPGAGSLAVVRLDAESALVVESRRAIGLDSGLSQGGALVYRVDASVDSGQGPVTVEFADGEQPAVRDGETLGAAPLQPGETYTDATSGVTVTVTASSPDADSVLIDAGPLAPASAGKRTIAYYQTAYAAGRYISPLPLVTEHTGIDVVNLAALHLNADQLLLNDWLPDDPRYDRVWADLGQMQAAGVKVVGMVGGAVNVSWQTLSTDFDVQYERLRSLVLERHLDGLDLDVETPTDLAVVEKVIDALRVDFGPSFLITLSPVAAGLAGEVDSLSELDYDQLYADRGVDIAWFNAQFYCGWGEPTPGDYGEVMTHQSADGAGIPASKVVMAAITNPDNCPHGNGWIGLDGLGDSIRALVADFPDFGGVAGWEYYNSLPGDTAAPWRFSAFVHDALTGAAPSPSPTPTLSPTPLPTGSASAGGDGAKALAATGGNGTGAGFAVLAVVALGLGVGSVGAAARRRPRARR